jgi:hypothetical protein
MSRFTLSPGNLLLKERVQLLDKDKEVDCFHSELVPLTRLPWCLILHGDKA